MTTWDLIIALFYHVDEQLHDMPKHPEAHLWPSEVVTLGLLHALKGVGNRAFHRWLTRDYRPLFPRLPERTRLFRLFKTHQDLSLSRFLSGMMCLSHHDTIAGGTTHGWCTVYRAAVPPDGVPGFHEPDPGRVSAAGPAL